MAQDCQTCDRCSLAGKPHPLPRIGKSPKFMVVFDYPNYNETKAGRLLEGEAATILKAVLKDNGLSASDAYFTALVKSPKQDKMLTNEQINGCTPWLQREIELMKPPVILTLGSNATRYFMPGSKGSPMELIGKVTFDPKMDASIVFGLNVTQIVFDSSKLKLLQQAVEKVASLLN
jgi:DNA polymerase-3 subunit alpha